MGTSLERNVYFTLRELSRLLSSRSVTRGLLTFRVAPERLTCQIDNCQMMGQY